MTDNYDYPPMNEHQLTTDELPKHDHGYSAADRGVSKRLVYTDDAGFLPEPSPDAKCWYESKTIWFNAIVIAVGLATSATPALEQYMSAEMYGVIATFVAFINAVLRLLTGKPIKGGITRG